VHDGICADTARGGASMVAVDTFGWVGLDSLTETEEDEDQRQ
jgi:hypothetical protein